MFKKKIKYIYRKTKYKTYKSKIKYNEAIIYNECGKGKLIYINIITLRRVKKKSNNKTGRRE